LNASVADLGPLSTPNEWAEQLDLDAKHNEGKNEIPGALISANACNYRATISRRRER